MFCTATLCLPSRSSFHRLTWWPCLADLQLGGDGESEGDGSALHLPCLQGEHQGVPCVYLIIIVAGWREGLWIRIRIHFFLLENWKEQLDPDPQETDADPHLYNKLKSLDEERPKSGHFEPFSFQVYLFLQVNKSSLEFVRFEAEIENYGSMENVLAKLDMRTIKLSGQDPRLFFYLKAPKCNWMNNIKWQLWIKEREKILVFSEIISLFDLLNINLQKYRYYWVSFNQIRYSYFFVQFILWLDQFVKYYLYGGFSNVYFS